MLTDSSSVISAMRVRVNIKTFYGRLFLRSNKQSDRVRLFYVRLAYTKNYYQIMSTQMCRDKHRIMVDRLTYICPRNTKTRVFSYF